MPCRRCKTGPRRTTRARSRSARNPPNNNFWSLFTGQHGNCVVAFVFIVVVLVSYLMSTVSYKHDQELNCMKKFMKLIEGEVNQAEKSCMKTAEDVRYLQQRSMQTIATHIKLPKKRKLIAKYDIDSAASTSTVTNSEEQIICAPPKRSRTCQTESVNKKNNVEEFNKMTKLLKKYKVLAARRGRKLKNLQRKCSRLVKKKADLETIIQILHEEMESEQVSILKNTLEVDNEVLSRYLKKSKGDSVPKEYPDEIKKFALTLHFLSPKAYNFVRDAFNAALPHPKTISKWYLSVDCGPGFTKESLEILKIRSTIANKKLYCALTMDEVAIRKQLQWDGTKYYGHIDFGTEIDGDDLPLASEALTFVLTCINESWKIPIGYFLIHGLSGAQKKNIVEQCVRLLTEHGVTVVSLTFDGAAANSAMATHLGCNLNPTDLKTTFTVDDTEVAILYDPCHDIKLVRNALGEKQILLDPDNQVISWLNLEKLNNLQMHEGLHAANKLSGKHIGYEKQKMKVKLATQLLSNSVADALEYCRAMEIPEFENCTATIQFIRHFNVLFDILNSRNLACKGYKKPLNASNINEITEKLKEIDKYIDGLKLQDGTLLVQSRKKTGFIGFKICIRSVLFIYEKYIAPTNPDLSFLPVYKLSQDHIEIFFGAIRSLGGFNNNPSAKAFMTAYKKLLVHAEFKMSRNGNCLPLDDISILHTNKKQYMEAINQTTQRIKMLDGSEEQHLPVSYSIEMDHDYIPDPNVLTEYSEDVIGYMAGFIVKKIKNKILCEDCFQLITTDKANATGQSLIQVKDRGGLIRPSNDVFRICKFAEKRFRYHMKTNSLIKIGQPKHLSKMLLEVFQICGESDMFGQITHGYDNCISNNHVHLIIKAIIDLYFKIRIHYECKKVSQPKSENVRSFYNKLVLFKGL